VAGWREEEGEGGGHGTEDTAQVGRRRGAFTIDDGAPLERGSGRARRAPANNSAFPHRGSGTSPVRRVQWLYERWSYSEQRKDQDQFQGAQGKVRSLEP